MQHFQTSLLFRDWESIRGWLKSLGSHTQVGDRIGAAPAVETIYGMNKWMEDVFLFSFYKGLYSN